MPSASTTRSRSRKSSRPSKSRARSKSRESKENGEQGRLRPVWSGTLTFGLVSIPVDLYPATRAARVALRMLAPDGSPVARRFHNPDDDSEVPSDDLVRGYEYQKGKYVEVTDEELEALEPDKSRDIDLRLFIDADTLDPMYFERTFFLVPSGDSNKAYHLLTRVMEREHRAGIATFVMRDHEYLVAILAQDGLLLAEGLRFHDAVRDASRLELPKKPRVDAKLVKQFETAIGRHAHDRFDPESIHNEHNEALRKLAEQKARKHADIVESNAAGGDEDDDGEAQTVDLMRLLKESLGTTAKSNRN